MAMAPSPPKGKLPPNDSPLYVPPKKLPDNWDEWVKEQERRQERNTNPSPDTSQSSERGQAT